MAKASTLNRYLAKIIDFLICFALSLVLVPVGPLAGLFVILIADGFWHGQSPGKKIIGLKVVHEKNSKPVSFKESLIRNSPFALVYIFFIVPFIGWFLLIIVGLPILIFESYYVYKDRKGIRVGDIMAGTQVIDCKKAEAKPSKSLENMK